MELRTLIDEVSLRKRVKELSEEISRDYAGKVLTVICVLKGAFIFTADLVRELKTETVVDFIRVKSYNGKEKMKTEVVYTPDIDIEGKDVLVVDDIFDTGESLELLYRFLERGKPSSIRSCVLLSKDVERKVDIKPDYVGFNIPDRFVVGYGLDMNELYRDLPFIGYFEEQE